MQNEWAQRRNSTWFQLSRPDPLRHDADLRKALTQYAVQLARDIDAGRPPSTGPLSPARSGAHPQAQALSLSRHQAGAAHPRNPAPQMTSIRAGDSRNDRPAAQMTCLPDSYIMTVGIP
jgi:hypothetical protein